ncbi:MAG: P-loop NTPase [Planctomycetes bacterium]|nr:P-loop NTPase [Planctomycetota bacterium]MCH9727424.1 P-loop NTPase [Planctomycetota bacterium]MCH9775929.1 P-loop NTPase [Planctomycetota bacterium]MCH9793179.1 P-loop NTPase [Planctomycetota bacterium]MDF1746311.1 P-loop NTPase [Gimesia sp.]
MAPAVNENLLKQAEAESTARLTENPSVALPSRSDQAKVLRGMMEKRQPGIFDPEGSQKDKTTRCRTIAFCSGKGGVGKSVISLNLALALAQSGASVCLMDVNLALGNIDLLCRLNGYWNLSHVVSGARSLKEIQLQGPLGINVVTGASGLTDLADCSEAVRKDVLGQMQELEATHDFLILDNGTGIHRSIRQFVTSADEVLIVTTPEPTAIADAYATIKSLSTIQSLEIQTLVNQCTSTAQGENVFQQLKKTTELFLHTGLIQAGQIPHDINVVQSIYDRDPVILSHPGSPAAEAILELAQHLMNLKKSKELKNKQESYFPRLWKRLLSEAA